VDLVAADRARLWHPFTQQRGWEAEDPVIVERAEGCELVDADGRRYLDGVSSLWCNVHGHRHPRIDAALRAQLDRVAHTTMLGLTHPPAIELAERLVAIAPPGLTRVFYSDSGSTAAEIALKMAFQFWQQRGGRHRRKTHFVSLGMAYHGDTLGSVSVGGIDLFHSLYRPLLFDSLRAEPGDAADMERLLAAHSGEVAAVIMEPLVQGAAGMLVHPPGYLSAVRELCDEHGALLILDEVQTGLGRTGTNWYFQQEGVEPDLLITGKGLGGGVYPISAVLLREELEAFFDQHPFAYVSSFGGAEIGCAAASAVMEEISRPGFLGRVEELGRRFEEGFAGMPFELRRFGLTMGLRFDDQQGGALAAKQLIDAGVFAVYAEHDHSVTQFKPPLIVTEPEVDEIVSAVRGALS
jgi:adenosylmethionine---8-amino-7-oxononanoate aminotransferase